ncbi:hypothetical protein [Helicobacter phage FrMEG235U]|nr:hypothetical protein [Helicobacter phage FrMEG235U]ANT43090.1 hypothetical protein [Helicobacter phage FrANT170U]
MFLFLNAKRLFFNVANVFNVFKMFNIIYIFHFLTFHFSLFKQNQTVFLRVMFFKSSMSV